MSLFIDAIKSQKHFISHGRTVFEEFFKKPRPVNLKADYLEHTMSWLRRAQDINEDGGVSLGYSFLLGWLRSFPETTGYIIPTFLNYYHLTKNEEYLKRATRMAEWLVSFQSADGSIKAVWGNANSKPIIFDTGQVLQGLASIYQETHQDKYLKSAIKAADWLVDKQDGDGAWRQYEFNDITHAYNTRVDWPLLMMYRLTSSEAYLKAASRNIEWVLGNQKANGWFRNNSFVTKRDPFLHTIAYVIEGLIESSAITQNKVWLEAAMKPSEVLQTIFENKNWLAGEYDRDWNGKAKYSCVTGNAQMAICWFRLYQLTNNKKFLTAALKMNNYLRGLQDITAENPGIKGAMKGSYPIWGRYLPFTYPNWAAKFFADALILERQVK